MIGASAPGKVVLWGEYAVLEGAPAAVLAINRYARCTVATGAQWRFSAHGFEASAAQFERLPRKPPNDPAARLPWHVLQTFPAASLAPMSVNMHSDAFHIAGRKLGLGASAALCVALQAAFAAYCGSQPNYADALAAHRRLQGGLGSGIDVASSFFGGCLRFQDGTAKPCRDPLANRCFLWLGESARTTSKLQRFADYVGGGDTTALRALAERSQALFDNPASEALRAYVRALKRLDKAAGLGVYSAPHLAAERLAESAELIYKPCGAGGGDVGVAVAESPEPLTDFAAAAGAAGFTVLNLQTAQYGVHLDPP